MPAEKDQLSLSHIQHFHCIEKYKHQALLLREHQLIQIVSGQLRLHSGEDTYQFETVDIILLKRNQFYSITMVPSHKEVYDSVNVSFDHKTLTAYALENQISPQPVYSSTPVCLLPANALYDGYFSSLSAYHEGDTNTGLTTLKVREALMIMLHLNADLKELLFDFSEPRKTNLREFMNAHYMFNVTIDCFAYLSGRSLATFKRDFQKTFHSSPNKWLQERRLKEAQFLIREKRLKPVDIYLDLGFADLSHFSFAFKNAFGKPPSRI